MLSWMSTTDEIVGLVAKSRGLKSQILTVREGVTVHPQADYQRALLAVASKVMDQVAERLFEAMEAGDNNGSE